MARHVEYYEMLERIHGVVSDYISGLTYPQISEKRGISLDTIGLYLRNEEALKSIYGINAVEVMSRISKRRSSNMRHGVVKIDLERIVSTSEEKAKSR